MRAHPPLPTYAIVKMPFWVCHPNRLHCGAEHVRKHYKEGGSFDQRRIDGHVFSLCDDCGQAYLAVFHGGGPHGKPVVYCYEISREQLEWWNSPEGVAYELDEHQPTQHLLFLLGYNRFYRPTNPRTMRPTPR